MSALPSSSVFGTIRQIVRHELQNVRVSELALVEEIAPHRSGDDQQNYACDVRLKNSGLLLKGVPVVTGHIGTVAIPNKGDLVLLTFDKGDVNQGFIVGRLYTDADRPPVNDANETIFRLPLAEADDKTVKAAIRNLQDQSPPREMIVEMPPKITVRITDGTVRATAGKTEMKLDQPGESGGTVTVTAGRTTITMNQDGDVAVQSAGAISIEADGDMSLKGQSVKISSLTGVDIAAQTQLNLSGTAGATLDGGSGVNLQGAMVSVSGMTSFGP
jgi:phage baseplate assembly protein gpV